jgi:acyl-coenzyme A synthetase/AMP-(fatty) acid ligase
MSAILNSGMVDVGMRIWPLLSGPDTGDRVVSWRDGRAVCVPEFLADVERIAQRLPTHGRAINLCEGRYAFLAGFCAAASRGHCTLLPSARTLQAIADVRANWSDTYLLGDDGCLAGFADLIRVPTLGEHVDMPVSVVPELDRDAIAAIGFTSGSTGQPKPNTKSWRNFAVGSALNNTAIRASIGVTENSLLHIVATVPSQHMYGMEMAVLLPLFGAYSVHSSRPFFAADIAAALAEVPEPRILVSTPVHLRNLLAEPVSLPPLAAIICATAPLGAELATHIEARCSAPLIELFGSTETCVIAHRRTAREADWRLHAGVCLQPQPDGTLVHAEHLGQAVVLQDLLETTAQGGFRLCGRNTDLLEIAGKRASLADLTRRLQGLDGVLDAVVFQLDGCATTDVKRIAALVVAPARTERDLLAELRQAVDPVFLPRPLRLVGALPRNEAGKLPREALLAAIGKANA